MSAPAHSSSGLTAQDSFEPRSVCLSPLLARPSGCAQVAFKIHWEGGGWRLPTGFTSFRGPPASKTLVAYCHTSFTMRPTDCRGLPLTTFIRTVEAIFGLRRPGIVQ